MTKKKKNNLKKLTPTEFSKIIGVRRERILKGINDGVISESVTKVKAGSSYRYYIDAEKGVREWADNIDPAKQRNQEKPQKAPESGEENKKSAFQLSKAAKEYYNAKMAELEYKEKAGQLVNAEKVKAETFKIGRRVRDTLLGVPDRVAAELANMKEPREISIYLKEQIALSLKDLGDLEGVGKPRK